MVREPDATRQPTPQDIQLMSKHRVLSLKPQPRPERRGQDGQNETERPDHPASLGDSVTLSTRIGFSVHTPVGAYQTSEDAANAAFSREVSENAASTRRMDRSGKRASAAEGVQAIADPEGRAESHSKPSRP